MLRKRCSASRSSRAGKMKTSRKLLRYAAPKLLKTNKVSTTIAGSTTSGPIPATRLRHVMSAILIEADGKTIPFLPLSMTSKMHSMTPAQMTIPGEMTGVAMTMDSQTGVVASTMSTKLVNLIGNRTTSLAISTTASPTTSCTMRCVRLSGMLSMVTTL